MSSNCLCPMISAALACVSIASAADPDIGNYPETPSVFYEYSGDYIPKITDRSQLKDSFKYYGPGGLWYRWDAAQRRGRDEWIFWTYGNQRFYRRLQVFAGQLPSPMSVDFFRLLDSRKRDRRFRDLGLINEPNCHPATEDDPDVKKYGLWLDVWKGDPLDYYPNSYYTDEHDLKKYWGEPTGIIGLRKFKNPRFTPELEEKWTADPESALLKYFDNPGAVEPPYLVGITCALCHISFDPTNPPDNPENPRWEHLAANIGNQYFDEGGLFVGRGRIAGGDQNPAQESQESPAGDDEEEDEKEKARRKLDRTYRAQGFGPDEFLWHYGATQQRGTSETSRFTYDFINNPNTINKIFYLGSRSQFTETAPNEVHGIVFHVLKDGADSVPLPGPVLRVPLNIGSEGEYLLEHIFDPTTGRRQSPVVLDELRIQLRATAIDRLANPENWPNGKVPPDVLEKHKQIHAERKELEARYKDDIYGDPIGTDWMRTEQRVSDMIRYLTSYTPFYLEDALKNQAKRELTRQWEENGGAPDDEAERRKRIDRAGKELVARHINREAAERGKRVFADNCARCHSNKQPPYMANEHERQLWYRASVAASDFLTGNTLADDVRYSVKELGTNSQRAMATNATEGDVWAQFSSKDYKALPPVGTLDLPNLVPDRDPIRYTPPGGGRGYYRTPSLVSVWATAPFGHANSIGAQPLRRYTRAGEDGNEREAVEWPKAKVQNPETGEEGSVATMETDPDAVTVAGRFALYQDACEQLLGLKAREPLVKVTQCDSGIGIAIEQLRSALLGLIGQKVVQLTLREAEDSFVELLSETAGGREAAEAQAKALVEGLRPQVERGVSRLISAAAEDKEAGKKLTEDLKQLLGELAQQKGVAPEKISRLKEALEIIVQTKQAALELKIPQGTPVNLYMNQHIASLPYALIAVVRHRGDPPVLLETLLKLTECPDVIENLGHYYGMRLSPEEKKDLIEFMKMF